MEITTTNNNLLPMNKILSKEVSYELAKLLFEKNYNENTKFGYNGVYEPHHLNIIEFGSLQCNSELIKGVYSAPTIAEVIDWIYGESKVWINVYQYKDHAADANDDYTFKHNYSNKEFKNQTEAYEEAIKHILLNLIK